MGGPGIPHLRDRHQVEQHARASGVVKWAEMNRVVVTGMDREQAASDTERKLEYPKTGILLKGQTTVKASSGGESKIEANSKRVP